MEKDNTVKGLGTYDMAQPMQSYVNGLFYSMGYQQGDKINTNIINGSAVTK